MKNLNFYSVLLSLCLLFGLNNNANAQISHGGTPPSFTEKSISNNYELREFSKPDMKKITEQDEENAGKKDVLRRIAVSIQANLNTKNSGTWTNLPDGSGRIWRLKIKSKDALALGIYYDNFWLPVGGRLYLYNEDKTQVIGAFTEQNNPKNGLFATELIQGETVTLEYFEPAKKFGNPVINISEIAYLYRDIDFVFKNKGPEFGSSDYCEINVNCSPEGDNWQDEKRGVARILVKAGANYGWCSGSLVNNVNQDCTPYFLTAEHCADGTSASDLNQWVFYFNYEGAGCSNPSTEPTPNSLTGATLKANNDASTGSDFYFVLLNDTVPSSYNPYYNGWNNENSASPSGVGIHHPSGDIKKISTYTSSLTSTGYNGNGLQSHWRIFWSATANDHGVTEGGSSGSPIFDNNGKIVGTLTGGSSFCDSPDDPDYYGKFSYHWDMNGSTVSERLKDWLDPNNTGAITLDGTNSCGIIPPPPPPPPGTCDTLRFPLSGTITTYYHDGFGYLNGNNVYGDLAKAEYFSSYSPYTVIKGGLFKFGAATGSSTVVVAVWDNSGDFGDPGSMPVAVKTVSLSTIENDINNSQYTYLEFDTLVPITGPFYLGVILPTATGDTLALVSNTAGDTNPSTAWEIEKNHNWMSYTDAYSIYDLCLAIFPYVCNTTPVNETFIEDIKIYPNPVKNTINIDFGNMQVNNLKIKIYNILGETILTTEKKGLVSKNILINIPHNSSGIYYIDIQTQDEIITRKISIVR
jgi:hypothetical protein